MSTETKAEPKPQRAVIYVDGGFRPSTGMGGWACHGYTYTEEKPKQGTGCKYDMTKLGYYNPAGYVAPGLKVQGAKYDALKEIVVHSYVNGFGTLTPPTTNNVAELWGLTKALEYAVEQKFDHVLIRPDSEYTMKNYRDNLEHWQNSKWTLSSGNPVANLDQWKHLYSLREQLKSNGTKVEFLWVKGHSGEFGNDTVDALAGRAITSGHNGQPIDYLQTKSAKGYWSRKNDRSRFINLPHWYFSALSNAGAVAPDGRHVYYTGFSGKGGAKAETDPVELLGRKSSDARYSIAYLTKPEPVLEILREASIDLAAGRYMGLMVGELRDIMVNHNYLELEEYGDRLLKRDFATTRLLAASGQQDVVMTREIRPARLAYNAIDVLNMLEQVLQHHLTKPNTGTVISTDITDILYETDSSKKNKSVVKLKSHITSTTRSLEVRAGYTTREGELNETKLKLTLGLDLPDRNTLAALACTGGKAWVVTWPESANAIRYATIVEAEGDTGMWCAAYSNLQLIKPKA